MCVIICHSLLLTHILLNWIKVAQSIPHPNSREASTLMKRCVLLPVISFAYLLEMESVFLRSGCFYFVFLSASNQLKLAGYQSFSVRGKPS